VLKALELEDARFFRNLSQIEAQLITDTVQNAVATTHSKSIWSRIWHRLRIFFSSQTVDEIPSASNALSAPAEFISELQRSRNFISQSFSDTFLDTMLAIQIFDNEDQWCCASSSALYLSKMRGYLSSFKLACRAMVALEKELAQKVQTSPKQRNSFMRSFSNILLGADARIFKLFSSTSIEELQKMLHSCNFQNVQAQDLDITPIEKLVDLKLQSLDIEGGIRRNNGENVLEHASAPEPTDANLISRPKVIASAVHRNGNGACHPLTVEQTGHIFSSAQCVPQNLTGPNEILQGFHDVSVSSGDRYLGHFVQGLRSGKGTYSWSCGDVFEGSWYDDERNGFGILRYQNGDVYEGEWVQGERSEWGKMTFFCGDTFQGEWSHDNFCGKGVYTFSDGRCLQGQWADGMLIKEYHVDISRSSKSQSFEDTPSKNKDIEKSLELFATRITAPKRGGLASIADLLFGGSQAQHLPVASRFRQSIHSKSQPFGHIPESTALVSSTSTNIDLGRTMVSTMFDVYQSTSSKASDVRTKVSLSSDRLASLEMETTALKSRNQAMKHRLEPLLHTFHEVSIDPHACIKGNTEIHVQFDVTRQANLIVELTEQLQKITSENDELMRELAQEDSEFNQDKNEGWEPTMEALSREAAIITSEISALKVDIECSRNENAKLMTRSRFISDQNKSFVSALKFRSDAPKLNRQ
jgi:hypothetical protein